ncbi:MAG: hypothetical protein BGO49_23035 [Planctomycetales bacterium 71-10]|nr:MAG: hypothetical protein BGO49_23035 [Planctomycetales bacterium 71-10]
MRFQGAVIREQGVTFGVVIVKSHVLQNSFEADRMISALMPAFPGMPVVLMAQDYRGVPTYYGRRDISRFMAGVPLRCVPWREYTLS